IVNWRVISGTNAVVSREEPRTNETGITSTSLQVGALGDYVVEATITGSTVRSARFKARAVVAPAIDNVSPLQAKPGDTLRVTGSNFSATVAENTLSFDGVQGKVLSATTTELRAVVPECIPARQVRVVASLGAMPGAGAN